MYSIGIWHICLKYGRNTCNLISVLSWTLNVCLKPLATVSANNIFSPFLHLNSVNKCNLTQQWEGEELSYMHKEVVCWCPILHILKIEHHVLTSNPGTGWSSKFFIQASRTLQDFFCFHSKKNSQLLLTQPVDETQSCSTIEASSYIWKTRWFMRVKL